MLQVLDAVDVFLDRLGSVDFLPLALAILCHLVKMACTSRAWRNVLAAAYADRAVPWPPIYAAYLAGVGVNAIIPARAGDAVRIVLAHRAIQGSTYTTVVSSTLALTVFDFVAASCLMVWALTSGELPGIDVLATLESFDFAWLLSRPLAFELLVGAMLILVAALAYWVRGHVENFGAQVGQAFEVFRPPTRYLVRVVPWQVADWTLRLATIWFLLDAFDIPQSLRNAALAQVATSSATLVPITPGGVGTEQALLLYVLDGTAAASVLLAYSVGAKLTLTATNVIAGFAAITLTLRTVRFRDVLKRAESAEKATDSPV